MRRLKVVLLAALLAMAAILPSVSPVAAMGFCNTATGTNAQKYVEKYASTLGWTTFNGVRGDVTIVSQLDACIPPSAGGRGTFVLPANMQSDSTLAIVQIAYGKRQSTDPLSFFWTPAGYGDPALWPGSLTPVAGHRIRATIDVEYDRWDNLVAHYSIYDITTGVTEVFNGTYTGPYNHNWWGVERVDTASQLGSAEWVGSYPYTHMAFMGYRHTSSTSWIFRTDLTGADIHQTSNVQSCEHAYIGSWTYSNDMVNWSNSCT